MVSNEDLLESINVLRTEVSRLNARLGDTINIVYNLEKRLSRSIGRQIQLMNDKDTMPRGMNTESFVVAHGAPRKKIGD